MPRSFQAFLGATFLSQLGNAAALLAAAAPFGWAAPPAAVTDDEAAEIADHLDLAEHPLDLPRRPENVRGTRTIPYAALATLRRG